MAKSKIEWTEKTWNPIVGCSKVSPGCENCYALRMAHRLSSNPNRHIRAKYQGTTKVMQNGRINWTGQINTSDALYMKFPGPDKPTRYFVNSMSDLFHPNVPFTLIDSIYEVMGFHTWHTFQILTKHPKRALEYYKWTNIFNAWGNWNHIWLGTSVEDQKRADERVEELLKIKVLTKLNLIVWLSMEPLLSNVFLRASWIDTARYWELGTLDWIVVGGESGPKARPMHPDWVRSIRDQCKAGGVPFFFKQWGEWKPIKEAKFYDVCNSIGFERTGKKQAGRLLDGKLYNEYPKEK